MNKIRIILLLGFWLISLKVNCQKAQEGYTKFMKDGIEYQTNGIDTICHIDLLPEFPGGQSEMSRFIHKNLKLPKHAKNSTLESKAIVGFIIDKSGDIRDIVIVKSIRDDIDNEIIRVIKMMPKWKPGEQNGNPVSFRFNLPLKIKI